MTNLARESRDLREKTVSLLGQTLCLERTLSARAQAQNKAQVPSRIQTRTPEPKPTPSGPPLTYALSEITSLTAALTDSPSELNLVRLRELIRLHEARAAFLIPESQSQSPSQSPSQTQRATGSGGPNSHSSPTPSPNPNPSPSPTRLMRQAEMDMQLRAKATIHAAHAAHAADLKGILECRDRPVAFRTRFRKWEVDCKAGTITRVQWV